MFTAALLIIAKMWGKNPKYPSADEWINQTEYNEILFHHKKNVVLINATWINLKHIMLSKRNQSQKTMCCIISFI